MRTCIADCSLLVLKSSWSTSFGLYSESEQATTWMRLVGLEGRFTRLKWGSLAYLPIIIICFGLGIGK